MAAVVVRILRKIPIKTGFTFQLRVQGKVCDEEIDKQKRDGKTNPFCQDNKESRKSLSAEDFP
jgi:hypothetical protein